MTRQIVRSDASIRRPGDPSVRTGSVVARDACGGWCRLVDITACTRVGARLIGAGPTALDVMVALRAVEKCVDCGDLGWNS